MTAPIEKTLNFGARFISVFELNTDGTPNATDTTAYEGLQMKGFVSFEPTLPDARKITGLGEDGITQVAMLPPNESVSGVINVEASDPAISVLANGTKINTVGELSIMGVATDKQGFEPKVALMMYQEARGLDTGKVYWRHTFIPSTRLIEKSQGMGADKGTTVYQIAPNRVTAHIWGVPYSVADDGFTSSQMGSALANYPYRLAAFLGDGTEVDMEFPADMPAVQTDGIKVFVDDAEVTTGLTLTVTKVTFASAPASGARIVILREVAG